MKERLKQKNLLTRLAFYIFIKNPLLGKSGFLLVLDARHWELRRHFNNFRVDLRKLRRVFTF